MSSSSSDSDESEASRRSEAPLRSPDGLYHPLTLRRNSLPLAIDLSGVDGDRALARRFSSGSSNAYRLHQLRQEDSPKEAVIREVRHEKGVTSTYQLSRSWEEGLHLESQPFRQTRDRLSWEEKLSVHSSPCPSPSPAPPPAHIPPSSVVSVRSGRTSESGSPVLSPLPSPCLVPPSPFPQLTRTHPTLKRKLSDERFESHYGSPPKRPNTRPFRSSSLGIQSAPPILNGLQSPPSSVDSLGSPHSAVRGSASSMPQGLGMPSTPSLRARESPTGSDKVFGAKHGTAERRLDLFDGMDVTEGENGNGQEHERGEGVDRGRMYPDDYLRGNSGTADSDDMNTGSAIESGESNNDDGESGGPVSMDTQQEDAPSVLVSAGPM